MSALTTRRVLAELRAVLPSVQRAMPSMDVSLQLSRAHGRRCYMLAYHSPMRAGVLAAYDAERRELWLLPTRYRDGRALDAERLTAAQLIQSRSELRALIQLGSQHAEPFSDTTTLPTLREHVGMSGYGYCTACGLTRSSTRYRPRDCAGSWAA